MFAPAVPIFVDYRGKGLAMSQGLQNIIMGLTQLTSSRLTLKPICDKKG